MDLFNTLPVELTSKICSYLVHDNRSWQHQLGYQTNDHLVALSQRIKIGHLRPLALTCKTMQNNISFFCSTHTYRVVSNVDSAAQIVAILRRLDEKPERALSIRRLHLGLDPRASRANKIRAHTPFLVQTGRSLGVRVPGVVRKDRLVEEMVESPFPTGHDEPRQELVRAISDSLSFLVALLLCQLKDVREVTLSTTPEFLATVIKQLQLLGRPIFPQLRSVALVAIQKGDTFNLESSVIPDLAALSPELSEIRIHGCNLSCVDAFSSRHNIRSIVLKDIILDIPGLHLLLKECRCLRTFMYFAHPKPERFETELFEPRTQMPKAYDIVCALQPSADTLRTLCLNLNKDPGLWEEPRHPFSVSCFKELQRMWINSNTVIRHMHSITQPATAVAVTTKRVSQFMRSLPASLETLHVAGEASELASEMDFLVQVGLKQLAVEPSAVKDSIDALEGAGVKVLGVADERPILW